MMKILNLKRGFTLAETLITLMIIGVVAAITIPVLMQVTTKNQNLVSLKKKYAEIQEAIKLSAVDNDEPDKWDYTLDTENFFKKYFAPYINTSACSDCWVSYHYEPKGMFWESPALAKCDPEGCVCINFGCFFGNFNVHSKDECSLYHDNCQCESLCNQAFDDCMNGQDSSAECQQWLASQTPDTSPDENPEKTYSLSNGATIGILKKESIFYFYIDVNGAKSPNKYGNDKFLFTVVGDKLQPFGYGEEDLTAGEYGCSQAGNGMYCAAMIMKNDWSYPDNYMK